MVLMGDQNAKIGNNNQGSEVVTGKHGIGEMNENCLHISVWIMIWLLEVIYLYARTNIK